VFVSAKSNQVSLKCENCHSSTPFTFWAKVSGDGYPDLKRKILDGSLFSTRCETCDTSINVSQDLRYSDYSTGKNFFVYLCPKEDLQKSYEFIQTLPMLRSNGTRIHVVNTVPELQTIIASYDLGVQTNETFIDQSVDSAKMAEALNRKIDGVFAAFEKGQAAKDFQFASLQKDKPSWSLMRFLGRLLGAKEPTLNRAVKAPPSPRQPGVATTSQGNMSEEAKAWTKAGGLIGPVGIKVLSTQNSPMNEVQKRILTLGFANSSEKLPSAVLGEVTVTMKDGQATSKLSMHRGANVLTIIEAVTDGRWVASVLSGKRTACEGLAWAMEAQKLMSPLPLLCLDPFENVSEDTLALTKAISAIAVADTLARRKHGIGISAQNIANGLIASAAKQTGSKSPTLREKVNALRKLFGMHFKRARALRKARRLRLTSPSWEAFLSEFTGFPKP